MIIKIFCDWFSNDHTAQRDITAGYAFCKCYQIRLNAKLLEGKTLVRIAPDGTQTELPFEAKNGKLIFTLDFANSELPVMLFRLLPQTAAL